MIGSGIVLTNSHWGISQSNMIFIPGTINKLAIDWRLYSCSMTNPFGVGPLQNGSCHNVPLGHCMKYGSWLMLPWILPGPCESIRSLERVVECWNLVSWSQDSDEAFFTWEHRQLLSWVQGRAMSRQKLNTPQDRFVRSLWNGIGRPSWSQIVSAKHGLHTISDLRNSYSLSKWRFPKMVGTPSSHPF
jgi:hypothetical protein